MAGAVATPHELWPKAVGHGDANLCAGSDVAAVPGCVDGGQAGLSDVAVESVGEHALQRPRTLGSLVPDVTRRARSRGQDASTRVDAKPRKGISAWKTHNLVNQGPTAVDTLMLPTCSSLSEYRWVWEETLVLRLEA